MCVLTSCDLSRILFHEKFSHTNIKQSMQIYVNETQCLSPCYLSKNVTKSILFSRIVLWLYSSSEATAGTCVVFALTLAKNKKFNITATHCKACFRLNTSKNNVLVLYKLFCEDIKIRAQMLNQQCG